MYCPRCSQQQVSEEARFCPRCGFQLGAVQALLAGEQDDAAAPAAVRQALSAPNRKRDALAGATVMLAGAITIALLTVSAEAGTPWQAVVIPLLLAWAALVSAVLLSGHAARELRKLFSSDAAAPLPASPSDLVTRVSAAARHQALPPAQGAAASATGSWRVSTAELAGRPSVTERTTGLLDKN